jgi:tRNA nucleotidyltransferase (CCA-adding enzyme)
MGYQEYITHDVIYNYAEQKINLKRDDVKEYRGQVNRLRDNLSEYINLHPDYNLLRMYHAGSVAKGTALRTLNDMDVAVYIKKSENEPSEGELLAWLQTQLQDAYKNKNIKPEQITISDHCVTIAFSGSGLKVDVSPVICDNATTDYGYLINKHSGKRVLTNIPLHLKFIRDRKNKQPHNYRQVIRLVKWWAKNIKNNDQKNPDFRFKSFLGELICAHLADAGQYMNDYITALEKIFTFIIRTGLKERIFFTDNYTKDKLPAPTGKAMEVFDPVNPSNNIVSSYSEANRLAIVEAAQDAFDAISEAQYATTKERALECWKRIFGSSFNY